MPKNVKFLKSAVHPRDYPQANRPEIALAGRSNAGKSTLLNGLVGKGVAKVSSTPGKTQLLNFFDVGEHYRLVDLPGYGYAAHSHQTLEKWKKMIENYFSTRGTLDGVLLVMDCRRKWQQMEEDLKLWLLHVGVPLIVVLTKSDKLKAQELRKKKKEIKEVSGCDNLFVTSSLKKTGFKELERFLFDTWVKEK